ncbi:MAG TPA: 3-deoxy-D-manno-octulosonic acid transferase [Parachlamydiaceae bacterium]|nr:3-deoxy-D-manno-octulosonic acid transferase [Parachlamydiaceae bacterium]
MFVTFFYECCLLLMAIVALPQFLYQMVWKGKYRKSLFKRFGGDFPVIKKEGRPLVWVHAVSLGETKAVAALVKTIKAEYNHPIIVFSTTTETGYAEACRSIAAEHHVYLPFDFGWLINRIMRRTAPDLLILCESDFWYNLLKSAKKAGAKTVLVNGKLSVRSLERFKKIGFFTRSLFSFLDLFCVQNQLYARRFEEMGVPKEKLHVTGNIKFDGNYARLPMEKLQQWRGELGIGLHDPVLVIGSSHHPEEALFLETLVNVWKIVPDLKVLLVPRHPERFNEVAGILQKKNIIYRRLSEKNYKGAPAPVILIDAMGLLTKCYQLADIAIVAGSYTSKVGGHNILEPSMYGVPVIFGPHMQTQAELVQLMMDYKAGIQVDAEFLRSELLSLLQDVDKRKALGDGGLRLASDVNGATGKTFSLIKSQFGKFKPVLSVL